MKQILILLSATMLLSGCKNSKENADAYGNFEVTEVIVSAETNGRILQSDIREGSEIEKGTLIALIDTTLFHLQKKETDAGIKSVSTRIASINAQNAILEQQIKNLLVNIKRIENMLKDDAATKKQYDDLTGQVEVLKKQITANNTQKISIEAEIGVYNARKSIIAEQIARCMVKSPLKGTVLQKYCEEGEMISAGRPLIKIADMSVMKLKVYVSGSQLDKIKTGKECTVRIDDGKKGYRNFRGIVIHISEKAEFTPKIIQTKEERVALVYAVIIEVPNDGTIKSGMPGEAIF
ncbi:MAG: HlyD family secretion protein [Bacteroidales bacterium]